MVLQGTGPLSPSAGNMGAGGGKRHLVESLVVHRHSSRYSSPLAGLAIIVFQRSRWHVWRPTAGPPFDGQLHHGNYIMLELSIQESEVLPCMDATHKQTLVVIIDDSPTICKILETCLRREGHQAISYLNPVQALQALLRGEIARPDVLFVDLVLPQMDGYEVIKRLRAKPEFKAIPIIAISGSDSMLDRLKARLAGANDYVTKPFKTQHIVALVQKYSSLDSN